MIDPLTAPAPARACSESLLEERIRAATDTIIAEQNADGHWLYELEVDASCTSEYVLLVHHFGETPDLELERKIGVYLRRIQGAHGGWPLLPDGDFDMSVSVKAYFALKMIGDDINEPHMKRAIEAILARGGAVKSNVLTRTVLSMYGVIPWRSVPTMPVEIMLMPRWFPLNIDRISYWARVVILPLLVIQVLEPRAINPRGVTVEELFCGNPKTVGPPPRAPHQNWFWFMIFSVIDMVLRKLGPYMPRGSRKRSIDKCVSWVTERLNGVDGLGAVFAAMDHCVKMYAALGFPPDHPLRKMARVALDKLVVVKGDEAYFQPCFSPVWDTALVSHTLLECGGEEATAAANRGLNWLKPRQILDVKGDWSAQRPTLRPGGWAFQYNNAYFPDLDDTAVIAMAMDRTRDKTFHESVNRALEWVVGLQSKDGGFGAFDVDNTSYYLNNIPFADSDALIDPPTADLTGRCLSMLAQLGNPTAPSEPVRRAIEWLRRDQLPDGSWFARWGINYIYGTWSALCALNAAGVDRTDSMVRKARDWLISIQNSDGGWGEDGSSYKLGYQGHEPAPSTASQTAWTLLALMAAGEVEHEACGRGVAYLLQTQREDGLWDEKLFSGTGHPRVLYLKYHGYPRYFPLWAMARYRNLRSKKSCVVPFGM